MSTLIKTYNDVSIPRFMYGTAWKKERTAPLVELAVETGFTAIDTANQIIHYDEARVGEALASLYKRGIERSGLFLQTKFTPVNGQDHRTPYDAGADLTTQVNQSMASSLEHLGTDYVDSYVLHGPYSRHGWTASDTEVWRTMEDLQDAKKTRIIGISNVSAGQLKTLVESARVKPMVVQNRCYAILGWDREVREICRQHDIIYQGFSLLTANTGALNSPELLSIARRLGATPAQTVFAFALSVGMLPLTGTCSREHMVEDLASVDFDLSPGDVEILESIAG
ncbi:MAG: aldo/keto reductase [Candidatus Melainabacteria bacterium]|nr:aldo/keto reductase [Candidatus Melainabacteria bacterium]